MWVLGSMHAIGTWIYNAYNIENGIYNHHKYHRFKLFEKLYVNGNVKANDRPHFVAAATLNKLIAMSRKDLACPDYYKFRRRFCALQSIS